MGDASIAAHASHHPIGASGICGVDVATSTAASREG